MPTSQDELLDAAIRHLERLRRRGKRFIGVSPGAEQAPFPPAVAPAVVDATVPRATSGTRAGGVGSVSVSATSSGSAPERVGLERVLNPAPTEVAADARAREVAMASLRDRVSVCLKCPHLAASRKKVVFGVGDIYSPLMFVGEAPGADEDELGEPFVGKAGQLLTRIITAMDMSRDTVYIANILKCRPDTPGKSAGNRKPTPEEMETCLPYLREQIELIRPKVIVALGATAVEGLLGKTEGITRLRGHWQSFQDIPLMPTYHPAFLLRNQTSRDKRMVWEDMLQVLEKLGRPISERQRGYFLKG